MVVFVKVLTIYVEERVCKKIVKNLLLAKKFLCKDLTICGGGGIIIIESAEAKREEKALALFWSILRS